MNPTTRSLLFAFSLLAAGLAGLPPCAADSSANEVVLFDGSNTDAFKEAAGYVLEDGLLKGKGRLIGAEPFSNYELHIEYRYTQTYTHLVINHVGVHPLLGREKQNEAIGRWLTVRATYRHMPGENAKLSVPQVDFKRYMDKGKRFDDRNVVPGDQLPRDAHGMVQGTPLVFIDVSEPIEIRRISLRPLDPDSPREFFELDGEAYTAFLGKGKEVYTTYCFACHADGTGAALSPVNRSLGTDAMQNGSDRLSLYNTLTDGYKTMLPQPQLTFEQRHQVAAYVSDVLFKEHNPTQYKPFDPAALENMPYPLYTAREEVERRNKPEDQVRKERGTFRDLGPLVVAPFGEGYRNAAHVLLDDDTAISYDLYGMNQINTRTEGFLDMMQSQYFNQRPSSITLPAGNPIPEFSTWFWHVGDQLKPPDKGLRKVPDSQAYAFKGYYLHDRQAILSYEVKGRSILERPSVVTNRVGRMVLQQLRVAPGDQPLQLALAAGVTASAPARADRLQVVQGKDGPLSLAIIGQTYGLSYTVESGFLLLNIPASGEASEFTVARRLEPWTTGEKNPAMISALKPGPPLDSYLADGPRRWPTTYTMAGKVAEDNAAYVMDTLPVPYENEYNAWMRTTAVAFFPDGRAVVTTYAGDVWIVSGIDQDLQSVTWSRFAAGLYQAFGVKVVDERIYVTTRNGIVRLHDNNQDGEADYYEQFFADPEVSANWHGYNFDLVRDHDGNFYYAKNGQFTDIHMEGGALQIRPDGKSYVEFATGFRTPNGMGTLGDGRIVYGENQGGYVPAGKISIVKQGSWHGGAVRSSPPDRVPDPPLINFPQEVDNSCGGQLWIDDSRFGPYSDMLMHTSCGHARAMMIFMDEFGNTSQAATQSFPFTFDSGVMRLDVNPSDGQVYLTGTRGWQINAPMDGCLQRIRYTGKPEPLLMEVKARTGGISLGFNQAIDPTTLNTNQFTVTAWNYKRAKSYGSANYRPSNPTVVGKDTWNVSNVTVTNDNQAVWIALPDIMPAHQVRVDYQVGFTSGTELKNTTHMTIHGLGPDTRPPPQSP